MKLSTRFASLFLPLAFSAVALSAHADEQIFRQYESVRDYGMGGLKITTGLYDDNFFGNPARAAANPVWRFTIFDPAVMVDNHFVSNVNSFGTGGGQLIQNVANTAGEDNHLRVQTTMPAWYLPPSETRRWAVAFAIITSSQTDLSIRQNYSISDDAIIDIGPAFTYAYQLLSDRSWSVGATAHLSYRLATNQPYTIADLLDGKSFSLHEIGQQGTTEDFDLGTTKVFPWHPMGIEFSAAAAINNVLGGNYNSDLVHVIDNIGTNPLPANRSFGFGFSAKRDIGYFFHDVIVGVEAYDIGNNTNGSLFRTIHMGVESRILKVLRPRLGINQGYLTAGAGIDLKLLEIEAATWGEELSLNPGGLQDRRYGIRVALQLEKL
jgi:hypothetical protein